MLSHPEVGIVYEDLESRLILQPGIYLPYEPGHEPHVPADGGSVVAEKIHAAILEIFPGNGYIAKNPLLRIPFGTAEQAYALEEGCNILRCGR